MPRNIVFVAPFPTDITMRFARAARRLDDVRFLGVVHTPPSGRDRGLYHDLVRVTDPLSVSDIIEGVEVLRRRHGQPYRIIGILESLMVQLGQARQHFGVPGTSARVADLFRDKSRMKAALREAGLPVARSLLITGEAEGRAFAEAVGFPLVLKPPAGLGARSTFRLNGMDELLGAVRGLGVSQGSPALLEEFLRGREFSFETITLKGEPRVHSISHYLPTCLEAVENPWIQWCCMLPRDISGAEYDPIRKIGTGAIKALGLEDGMTHMEWFQRPDGSMVIGEIAQRPAGANISIMNGWVHDVDIYRAWARAVVDGELDAPWNRKYAVGTAFLRGMGRGRVARVTGLHEIHESIGKWIVEAKLPRPGMPKAEGYEGEGYLIVRDPSTDVVKKLLKTIIDTVRVHYA